MLVERSCHGLSAFSCLRSGSSCSLGPPVKKSLVAFHALENLSPTHEAAFFIPSKAAAKLSKKADLIFCQRLANHCTRGSKAPLIASADSGNRLSKIFHPSLIGAKNTLVNTLTTEPSKTEKRSARVPQSPENKAETNPLKSSHTALIPLKPSMKNDLTPVHTFSK